MKLKKHIQKLKKNINFYFILGFLALMVFFFYAIKNQKPYQVQIPKAWVPSTDSVIHVLIYAHSTDYFVYKNYVLGFQTELFEALSKYLKKPVKIIATDNFTNYKSYLFKGLINIYSFDYFDDFKFNFFCHKSEPIYETRPVLVSSKSRLKNTSKQKTVHVPGYFSAPFNLSDLDTNTVWSVIYHKDRTTEDLLELLNRGWINYVISSERAVKANLSHFKNLHFSVIGEPYAHFWMIPQDQDSLEVKINQFLKKFKKSDKYKLLRRKYFTYLKSHITNQPMHLIKDGWISPFDDIIKKESKKYHLDWRLIAAVMYQESRFNPDAIGRGGSFGLMQIMPNTGKLHGITPDSSIEKQIATGVKIISELFKKYKNIPHADHRICFVLAAYNAGICHIKDARALAKKHQKDADSWTDVAEFLKLKRQPKYYIQDEVKCGGFRAEITLNYVDEVLSHYELYKSIFPK